MAFKKSTLYLDFTWILVIEIIRDKWISGGQETFSAMIVSKDNMRVGWSVQ